METKAAIGYFSSMKLLIFLSVPSLLFGGGGYCLAGAIGGVVGLILLVCFGLHFTVGFRPHD
jgi:hypothetical protein